jgi:D-amino-acid dehydrogenase
VVRTAASKEQMGQDVPVERVVVIGGGIVGASAAYRLAIAGVPVTLVDRGDPGRATDAGAGIVAPAVSRTPPGPWYALASNAVDFYQVLLECLTQDGEPDAGYRTVGGLFVATNDDERARLQDMRATIEARARDGMGNVGDVSVLEPDEVERLFPPIAPGTHAVHVSDGARMNGRQLRQAIIRAARRHGAEVRHAEAVVRIERGAVRGVESDGDRIPCDRVILASGAWPPRTSDPLESRWPVSPQRGQIAHLDLPGATTAAWPFVVGFHTHYLLAFPQRRVVAGATREDGAGFDHRTTAEGLHEVLREALRVAPGLAEGTVLGVRVGTRPMSPDGLPILGPFGAEGMFLADGLGPSGLMMGPLAGALVADMVLGREPDPNLEACRPDRFEVTASEA